MEFINILNPLKMKNLSFAVVLFLFTITATAQKAKKMVIIPEMEVQVDTISVEATPRFITEYEVIVISQNNRDVFDFAHDNVLEKDVQYFFILEVDPTTKGSEMRRAVLLDFCKTPRQIYGEKAELIKKYNL